MASKSHQQLHFILFPFLAQGHMIPMIDIAKLLAKHGVIVTIVTTPLNSKRYTPIVARAVESGLQIHLFPVQFPSEKVGLPKECESVDMLPSLDMLFEFCDATNLLQEPVERLLQEIKPKPSCIISDTSLPYTSKIATKLRIPRISFNGFSCFTIFCYHIINTSGVLQNIKSESESFVVPGLPDHIELTKEHLLEAMFEKNSHVLLDAFSAAEKVSYGMIINSFDELEPPYVQGYKKERADKVWCIGPVSLCNKDSLDNFQRGDKAIVQESECMKFLDSQKPDSVIYVCMGSLCNLPTAQLIELGLGIEASNKPFIWVIRGGEKSKELLKWIEEDGFEERTKGRSLLIRGWAPQVVILSHPSVGGFLTHCGWNSSLEAICAGKPMVTWPLFGDQFCNEKLIADVLQIGVKVGAEVTIKWGQEEKMGVLVKRENVTKATDKLMDGGEESKERSKRAKAFSRKAKEAMEEGGSSYRNIELLIQDIMQQQVQACTE